jgi:hypothetical protein
MKEQRRLAAVVSADVAGNSRLMGRDESGMLSASMALHGMSPTTESLNVEGVL